MCVYMYVHTCVLYVYVCVYVDVSVYVSVDVCVRV